MNANRGGPSGPPRFVISIIPGHSDVLYIVFCKWLKMGC